MTTRCKPGDLCVVIPVGDELDEDNVGKFLTVVTLCEDQHTDGPHWVHRGADIVLNYLDPRFGPCHYLYACVADRRLKPIRGQEHKAKSTENPRSLLNSY